MADYAPAVRKILSESGCRLERQGKGDHEIWYSPLTKLRFTVDGKIRSRHTRKRRSQTGWSAEAVLNIAHTQNAKLQDLPPGFF